jgi:hypothetical protein
MEEFSGGWRWVACFGIIHMALNADAELGAENFEYYVKQCIASSGVRQEHMQSWLPRSL